MSALRKAVAFTITSALVGSSITAAFAETQWERNHPRRDQVNDRLSNQSRRINKELKEGEVTKQQANQLHREDHAIRQEERTMARSAGRVDVTLVEYRRLLTMRAALLGGPFLYSVLRKRHQCLRVSRAVETLRAVTRSKYEL